MCEGVSSSAQTKTASQLPAILKPHPTPPPNYKRFPCSAVQRSHYTSFCSPFPCRLRKSLLWRCLRVSWSTHTLSTPPLHHSRYCRNPRNSPPASVETEPAGSPSEMQERNMIRRHTTISHISSSAPITFWNTTQVSPAVVSYGK